MDETATEIVEVHEPREDPRAPARKPWLVVVRHGRTFGLVDFYRFGCREDADAFYREHTP